MKTHDKIQTGILIVLAIQAGVLIWQTSSLRNHFAIEQRPIVVSDVRSAVLGGKEFQDDITPGDEFVINVTTKNIGKSPAYIKYIKVKAFTACFIKEQDQLNFQIWDFVTKLASREKINAKDKYHTETVTYFIDSVLSPNQETKYETMVDAKQLIEKIRSYTTTREAPIFVEYEVCYLSMIDKKKQYWHNSIYEIQFPQATHIKIYTLPIVSNIENKPLHLSNHKLLKIVAERQQVKLTTT